MVRDEIEILRLRAKQARALGLLDEANRRHSATVWCPYCSDAMPEEELFWHIDREHFGRRRGRLGVLPSIEIWPDEPTEPVRAQELVACWNAACGHTFTVHPSPWQQRADCPQCGRSNRLAFAPQAPKDDNFVIHLELCSYCWGLVDPARLERHISTMHSLQSSWSVHLTCAQCGRKLKQPPVWFEHKPYGRSCYWSVYFERKRKRHEMPV